jgi:hypothetical protein
MTRLVETIARAVAVGFWYLTAVFAWLISVPFAYQNFIKPRLLPDFVAFAEPRVAGGPVAGWMAGYVPRSPTRGRRHRAHAARPLGAGRPRPAGRAEPRLLPTDTIDHRHPAALVFLQAAQ